MSVDQGYTKSGMMRVFQIIEEFRKTHPDMQIQTCAVFVTIAINPGITMKELQDRTGLAQASVSRNVSLLSENIKINKKGLGWVRSTEDPTERRRKIVKLTTKGKRMAEALEGVIDEIAEKGKQVNGNRD